MFVKSNDSMKHEQSMWDDEQVRLKRTIKTMRIRLAGKTHADKLDGLSYRGTIARTSLLHDVSVRTGVSQPTQFQSSSRHNIGETVTSHSSLANSGNQVTLAKSGKRVKFRSDNWLPRRPIIPEECEYLFWVQSTFSVIQQLYQFNYVPIQLLRSKQIQFRADSPFVSSILDDTILLTPALWLSITKSQDQENIRVYYVSTFQATWSGFDGLPDCLYSEVVKISRSCISWS